jgi:hypothetical protein
MMYLDDAQTVFFTRQLAEIDQQLYNIKFAELEAKQLVDVKPLNPGAETYIYRQYDRRGVAKITSNYATSSPRADVAGLEFTAKIYSLRESFGFNVQEIRAATMAGLPLDAMRAMAARRAIDEGLNKIGLLGDSEHGLLGLFNQTNAQTYTVPNDGTGSSQLWANKTADQIVRDMFGIVDQIPTNTAEVEHAKRLLLPYPRLRFANSKRLAGAGDSFVTCLNYFKMNRPEVEVRGALFLDTAGSGSTARMVAYDPDPVNVQWLVPIPFETFPPQLHGLEYVTECHARAGGVVARYPMTIAYGDGI